MKKFKSPLTKFETELKVAKDSVMNEYYDFYSNEDYSDKLLNMYFHKCIACKNVEDVIDMIVTEIYPFFYIADMFMISENYELIEVVWDLVEVNLILSNDIVKFYFDYFHIETNDKEINEITLGLKLGIKEIQQKFAKREICFYQEN